MSKPTARQTADLLTQIEQLAGRLRTLEPNLRHRAQGNGPDGYPNQSGAGAGGGEEDPVGTVVAIRIDHPERDVLGYAHNHVLNNLDEARRLLEEAESAGIRALPPQVRRGFDDGCVSCARIKAWSPISRTRRCRWCSDWASCHQGEEPPAAILRAHHRGQRITVRLAEAITKRRP